MANVAELNTRIGADIKPLQKAIRDVEKTMRNATSTLADTSRKLTLAISAPLAGFGVLAIKAAGEFETLQKALTVTMENAGRSTAEATAELENLRKAAEAPGLDFEQAIKGSVRLQGVGFAAEEARRIISELANSIASTGGSADQLDSVTKQFTQIIGKGRIMQEDLSIILENMPALAKVMKDEFGTATAEGLRALGVSTEDFITRVTNRLETLPRVTGGIANSIVNAGVAVKLAMAKVGEEINRTFKISEKLDAFATWVSNLAQRFSNLDDSTKRVIAGVAVFAITLGPLLKVAQGVVWIVGQMQVVFLSLQKALALSMTAQGIPGLVEWWRKLNVVMKANYLAVAVSVLVALGAALYAASKDMSAAAQAQRKVEEVSRTAADAVQEETTRVTLLTGVLKDNTKSLGDKKAALLKLQAINPIYFGSLDAEKSKIEDINAALDDYKNSILKAAKAKAAFDQIVEIDKKLNNLSEAAGDASLLVKAMQTLGATKNPFIAAGVGSAMREQREALEAQKKALIDIASGNEMVTAATKGTTAATAESTGKTKEAKTELDLYLESVKKNEEAQRKWNDARAAMGISDLEPLAKATPQVASLSLQLPGTDEINAVKEQMAALGAGIVAAITPADAAMKALATGTMTFSELFAATSAVVTASGNLMQQTFFAMSEAMQSAAENGAASFGDLAKAALAAGLKIIRMYIQQGVAAAVASALKLPFPLNLAAAGIAGAAASSLFTKMISSIGIPALAEGGLATSPTLAMVGDNPGANVDPEVIAPLSKLKGMMETSGNKGGGRLVAVVSGRDLRFILEQAGYDAQRTRGY